MKILLTDFAPFAEIEINLAIEVVYKSPNKTEEASATGINQLSIYNQKQTQRKNIK
ncbi:hypothetical protein [Oceanobacillus sp. CAU 1775]